MKAAWYERPGPAEEVLVVGEMPTPSPQPGEVLVRVAVSAAHPSDVKLRAGGRPGAAGLPFPRIIPHSDGAGTIEAVGEGVDPGRVGERVWLWNGQWNRPFGTCAEYIALSEFQAPRLPDAASFADGACLGIPALTAHACLFNDGPLDGRTVMVTGGAGAVSLYAIRMAKRAGARVLTTVSGPEKAALALEAGADHAVNYRTEDVAASVTELTEGYGLDHVVDLEIGSNIDAMAQVIRPNGVIVGYGSAAIREPALPFYALMFKRVTLRTELVYLLPEAPRRQAIAYLEEALEAGALSHAVSASFALDDVASAHGMVEAGNRVGGVHVTL